MCVLTLAKNLKNLKYKIPLREDVQGTDRQGRDYNNIRAAFYVPDDLREETEDHARRPKPWAGDMTNDVTVPNSLQLFLSDVAAEAAAVAAVDHCEPHRQQQQHTERKMKEARCELNSTRTFFR